MNLVYIGLVLACYLYCLAYCFKIDTKYRDLKGLLDCERRNKYQDLERHNHIIARLIKTANVTVEQRKSEFVTTENERHEVKAWCVIVNGMAYKSCNTQEEAEKAKEQFIKDYVEGDKEFKWTWL